MNISPRLAASILAFAAFAAHAEVKTFVFTGTVTAQGNTPVVQANDKITGSFSYDTSDQPDFPGAGGDLTGVGYSYASYSVYRPLQAKVNGHTIECSRFDVTIDNNFGGNREDMIHIGCEPIVFDGTKTKDGVFGITLATGPGMKDAITDTSLPSVLDLSRFEYRDGVVFLQNSRKVVGFFFIVDEIITEAVSAKRR